MNSLNRFIRYPIYPVNTLWDRLAINWGRCGIIFCPVCGNVSHVVNCKADLRESCFCSKCGAFNRQRQIAYVICISLSNALHKRVHSLRDITCNKNIVIYNTEAGGAINNILQGMDHYTCSEYFGPQYKAGDKVNGVLHEDLTDLSFESDSFDIVLSTEVFEHIPLPYNAHREVYRVLKPGGKHIFTVPFYPTEFLDETRAIIDEDGKTRLLKEPQYHIDPTKEEGILAYTIFSLQMLIELKRLGFHTNMYHLHSAWHGILGSNAIVFEAIKRG